MIIQNFSFSYLSISASEIEELMGFEPGQSPEPFPGLIDQALQLKCSRAAQAFFPAAKRFLRHFTF